MTYTEEQKRDFLAEHFCYEVNMLFRPYFELGGVPAPDTIEHNMFVEVVLIHARNLLEFYYRPTSASDQAKASLFVRDVSAWESGPGQRPGWVNRKYSRMCKRISHLSMDRDDPNLTGPWDFRALLEPLKVVTIDFIDALPSNIHSQEISDLRDYILSISFT